MNENPSSYLSNSNPMIPNDMNQSFPMRNQNMSLNSMNQMSMNNSLNPMNPMPNPLSLNPLSSMNNLSNNIPMGNMNLSTSLNSNHLMDNSLPQFPMNQMTIKEEKLSENNGFSLTYNHKLPQEERQLYDGSVKSFGIVIKQSSFLVVIVSHHYPLENCDVDCSLIYDNAELSEAHYINQKPISFSSQVNSNNTMNVELRISVLSSSHEDMLFRVRFDIYNAKKEKIATLYSGPLKVISKADSKKKPKQSQSTKQNQSTSSNPKTKSPRMPNCFKKETKTKEPKESKEKQIIMNENVPIDTENLLQTLQYQQSLLKEISQYTSINPLTQPLVVLLARYMELPPNQRVTQMIQFMSELSPAELMIITELVEVFRTYKKN